ncbi:FAD-dependent monooxygenase [Salinimonas marina]|uniref:FAD-dependent monooxygenase n=1 Tax=Salinimonas marina TaxID=2785918 RepID=A0A7S9DYI1_9ALTE|nr:FAD-dependent monooxygenase [Salinimonas marina]QPG06327.1 FAD-dependent monooxygenase [Salinimonas marina]
MEQTDIAIVGGGTIGHALAAGLLAHTAFKVTLLDANPAQPAGAALKTKQVSAEEPRFGDRHEKAAGMVHPGFDARVIALARRTVDSLQAMGVPVDSACTEAIGHIQITDQGSLGFCQLHAEDFRLSSFGEVIALKELGRLLTTHNLSNGLNYLVSTPVHQLHQGQGEVILALDEDEKLSSKLVILADGGRSGLAEQVGIERTSMSYEQVAITCNVLTSEAHYQRAYERFTPHGPLAFLPFNPGDTHAGHSFSMVWTVAADKAQALLQLADTEFLRALQRAFGYRQGRIYETGPRHAYPLELAQANQLTSHRIAMVGNAAQTLHPIAGQGFNLGLRDTLDLVETLTCHSDPGSYGTLRQFEQARSADREQTIWLTDALVRGFSNRYAGLGAMRNAGLIALDNVSALQQAFVARTTGYGPATGRS